MLKNIRLHIEKDELKQHQLEQKLATSILDCQNKNMNSFARNIPSLLPLINQSQLQNHSLFCNKFGEINIVDYGVGRTLYGFHPEEEVNKQVDLFLAHSLKVELTDKNSNREKYANQSEQTELSSVNKILNFPPAPNEISCVVVLGCGLGLHILSLMKQRAIKYLIIYEPEIQYFQCSALVTPWFEIFELAKKHNTQIFMQIEKDGRDIIQDMTELQEHVEISEFYLYQHYNHSVFNNLFHTLSAKPWAEIERHGISFSLVETYNYYAPTWTPPIDLTSIGSVDKGSPLFIQNLAALEQFFPNIYNEFKTYTPKVWLPIVNACGEVNIIKKDVPTPWYSDNPKQDCLFNYENFNEQPNKDGLVLGYRGTKLAHYLHYQFVKETEALLAQAEQEVGALPQNIASIIMFGLGVGYQLETLLEKHQVEKLFLCEPNTDFFYASLFAIDWKNIFDTVDKSGGRIYLNIGDDGTNLFRDLLGQFHSIGPYILNNTYFYQSYYNASLNAAIGQLREQLQIVISMGEYFDHAYYGISHTKEGLRRQYPLLCKNPASKLSFDTKEVPIFIVGNGPSLDYAIEAIKEWQDKAIIISCGTTLQVMYKHGITPDFHAEIEQNRSTFDWPVLIGDLDYLKNITLISCNGIHPDTCTLYKEVLIAFKEGESSTVSALSVLGVNNYEVLKHAFPTVSNFSCDLFSLLGFSNIYLLGVDLGFVDVKHHHSKSSGYYQEDGNETYDYALKNNTSLVVPGNFRPTVNTKHEFKVSRQIIEQVTNKKPKEQTFYNCSDGAKIQGTLPLKTEDMLIVVSAQQKRDALEQLKTQAFSKKLSGNFIERYENQFSQTLLLKELNTFNQLLIQEVETEEQINHIINKQKEMLFASYKRGQSLLFYYLYGTVNYANAVLTKLRFNTALSQEALRQWHSALTSITDKLTLNINSLDNSCFKESTREEIMLKNDCEYKRVLIVTDSSSFACAAKWALINIYAWLQDVTICSAQHIPPNQQFEFVIYSLENPSDTEKFDLSSAINSFKTGLLHTVVITDKPTKNNHSDINCHISFLLKPALLDEKQRLSYNNLSYACIAIKACIDLMESTLIIPKLKLDDLNQTDLQNTIKNSETIDNTFESIIYRYYSILPQDNKPLEQKLTRGGVRGVSTISAANTDIYLFELTPFEKIVEEVESYINFIPELFSTDKFNACISLNAQTL